MDIHSKKASSTLRTLRQSGVYVYIYMCVYVYVPPLPSSTDDSKPPSEKRKWGKAGDVEHRVEKAFSRNRLRLRSRPFGLIRPGSVDFKNVRFVREWTR